jgi:hypothetical protein
MRALLLALVPLLLAAAAGTAPVAPLSAPDWRAAFAHEVDRRLDVPQDEQAGYAARAQQALERAGYTPARPEFVLVVDRDEHAQAALLYVADVQPQLWQWIGATPVSTGRPGGFEHFLTPLGVYEHHLGNPDFRAEGTRNDNGIRGYGLRGMRVFDFGWVKGERTWGDGGTSPMRLQLHATDPQLLEPRLGRRESKGCVRVPAALNRFLDLHGVLDADYDAAVARGQSHWVLSPERQPTPWAGRFMVIVDTGRSERPMWSPLPGAQPPAADARAPSLAQPLAC